MHSLHCTALHYTTSPPSNITTIYAFPTSPSSVIPKQYSIVEQSIVYQHMYSTLHPQLNPRFTNVYMYFFYIARVRPSAGNVDIYTSSTYPRATTANNNRQQFAHREQTDYHSQFMRLLAPGPRLPGRSHKLGSCTTRGGGVM